MADKDFADQSPENQDFDQELTKKTGPVAWFAGHHVAANLLMIFVLLVGALSLSTIIVEVFPEFSTDMITVTVAYPGAAPEETEKGVVVHIEEAVASIEGIDRVIGTAAEGAGSVMIELTDDANKRYVLDEVKSAVDRIITFPEDIEEPVISEVLSRRGVINLAVYGDAPLKTLSTLAEKIRDDLTNTPAISQAEMQGVPPYEISIEVSEDALRRYGLSFAQVADAVRGASLDLPGGSVKTSGGELLLRTQGQMYTGDEFEKIVVVTRGDGTRILLGDLATVVDGFADNDVAALFNDQRAVSVQVYRTGEEGALEITTAVYDYLEGVRADLPAGVYVETWQDQSVILRQRISLLLNNAALGLVLVFIVLALFLDLRLAFWTTMGIPISFMGGLFLLSKTDISINMISLFAFIVSLGIVVDDAIIVGENVFAKIQLIRNGKAPKGMTVLDACVAGAREMATPVTFAVLTSVAAFLPLVFVEGMMGKVMRNIPLVVISVLVTSLVESLLILPAHLSGGGKEGKRGLLSPLVDVHTKVRHQVARGLDWMVAKPYKSFLEAALEWRYLTAAAAVALLALSGSLVGAGIVKFELMPAVDADDIIAYVEMPQGTPVEDTMRVTRHLESSIRGVGAEIDAERGLESSVIQHISTTIGQQPSSGGFGAINLGPTTGSGAHLAELKVELLAGEERGMTSSEVRRRWREAVGEIPGVTSVVFESGLFSAGDAISVQLAHSDFDQLLVATDRLKEKIAEYPGITDISDSFVPGKRELKVELTPEGRALGLTRRELARQVRQGFYGEEAQRIQRGRNDVKVMVRYPEAERSSSGDIENMRIRLRDGTEVPFTTVATASEGRGYATISRVDRRRVVTVTADVEDNAGNANEINADIAATLMPALIDEIPGLSFDFEGEERERAEGMGSLFRNFIIALLVIFSLLAIPFRSYTQPLIVMSAIPFGFVGALVGHMIMGMDFSMLSFFGMVALTGVVVNDSLVLIDRINNQRRAGVSLDEAIREAGGRRFRPILLTTLTTFFGLMPMILETSMQAQFMIPMAISLGFGVVFATVITLVLVPVIYRILEDFHDLFGASEEVVEEESFELAGGSAPAAASAFQQG